MKLRRLATTVAATSALVLTGAVPAIADHADEHTEPVPDYTFDGVIKKCDDEELAEVLKGDDLHGKDGTQDPWTNDHGWWTIDPDDPVGEESFDLLRDGGEGYQLAVLVKGGATDGGEKTNLFLSTADAKADMLGLFAPAKNGKHPAISHYGVCKVKNGEVVMPPPDEEEPPPDEEEPPPDEEEPEPEGKGGGEPTETPAPVPTEIPAGTGTADAGTAGTAGLVAMIAAFAAGAAVIVRRRFLTE